MGVRLTHVQHFRRSLTQRQHSVGDSCWFCCWECSPNIAHRKSMPGECLESNQCQVYLASCSPWKCTPENSRQLAEMASAGLIGGFGLVLGDFEEGGRKQGLVLDGCCQEAGSVWWRDIFLCRRQCFMQEAGGLAWDRAVIGEEAYSWSRRWGMVRILCVSFHTWPWTDIVSPLFPCIHRRTLSDISLFLWALFMGSCEHCGLGGNSKAPPFFFFTTFSLIRRLLQHFFLKKHV